MTRSEFLLKACTGCVLMMLIVEVVLAGLTPVLPEPREWYNVVAHAKAEQIEDRRRKGQRTDVVFAGPSTVFRGVDADLFERLDPRGRTAYNAGIQGAYPPITKRWLRDTVIPKLRPRTVVYGLSSLDFHDRIFRGSMDAYRTARATRQGFLAGLERFAARYSRVIKLRPLLRDPTEYDYLLRVATGREKDQVETTIRRLSSGGFQPKQQMDLEEETRKTRRILRGFDIGPRGTKHVRDVVEGLQARGTHVILVNMPVPHRFAEIHPGGPEQFERFERHLAWLARDLGVELLDPPDDLRRPSLFADLVHLDAQGARRFTRWLAEELSASEGGP